MSTPLLSSFSSGGVRVLDASAVINLNATDCAHDILRALGDRIVVVDTVVDELAVGTRTSREDPAKLQDLVAGRASETLDDGEAASIAFALESGGAVVIDERKANRICRERFPQLRLACTVDIFLHPAVGAALGRERLISAVLSALQRARMQVPVHHLASVVDLVGVEQAGRCPSLPRSVREPLRQK